MAVRAGERAPDLGYLWGSPKIGFLYRLTRPIRAHSPRPPGGTPAVAPRQSSSNGLRAPLQPLPHNLPLARTAIINTPPQPAPPAPAVLALAALAAFAAAPLAAAQADTTGTKLPAAPGFTFGSNVAGGWQYRGSLTGLSYLCSPVPWSTRWCR